MAANQTHVKVRDSGGIRVVEFTERKILDELVIHEIGEELGRIIDEADDLKLLLSFKNVDHLSSAALGMLINLNKQVSAKEGELKLSDISAPIFEVFKITRLNKLFSIHPTMAEAIADFS
jgi:anti-sigma B factor antagonist